MAALKPEPPLLHTGGKQMCRHLPACPRADYPDRKAAARTVAFHPEQGWSLLCNGLILFDDLGEILPDGRAHSRLPAAA
jgi:hypothetical protein